MTISFNTIPSNTLVPLFYAEMDNQAANTAQDSGASLLIGHANTAGTGAPVLTGAVAAMADEPFDYIGLPFNDTASVNTLVAYRVDAGRN